MLLSNSLYLALFPVFRLFYLAFFRNLYFLSGITIGIKYKRHGHLSLPIYKKIHQ